MSSNNFIGVRVKIKGEKRGFGFWTPPVALFVLRDAVVSFDGYLGLIPGKWGEKIRKGADSFAALFYVLMETDINVDVSAREDNKKVRVRVKTF